MTEIKSVCVFCGSSNRVDPVYQQAALDLGTLIAQNGLRMVFGGGRMGLMGTVSNAAVTTGGYVIGVTTQHLHAIEKAHDELSELYIVETMHERKHMMSQYADAYIILPGGFGTLEEAFEVMTWRQIGLIEKPIIFINLNGYWEPLRVMLDMMISERFAMPEHLGIVQFVNSVPEALEALHRPALDFDPMDKWRENLNVSPSPSHIH